MRTLVIVSSIQDAYRLNAAGLDYAHLNIGNNKGTQDSKQISYSVWVNQNDLKMLSELMQLGVEITLQSVPRERTIDMKSIIEMVAK